MGRAGGDDGRHGGFRVAEAVGCEALHRLIEALRTRHERREKAERECKPEAAVGKHRRKHRRSDHALRPVRRSPASPAREEGRNKGLGARGGSGQQAAPPSRRWPFLSPLHAGRGRRHVSRTSSARCCSCRTSGSPSRPRGPSSPAGGRSRRRPARGPSSANHVELAVGAHFAMSTGLVMWWFGSILETPPVRFGASMPGSVSMTLSTSTVPALVTARPTSRSR